MKLVLFVFRKVVKDFHLLNEDCVFLCSNSDSATEDLNVLGFGIFGFHLSVVDLVHTRTLEYSSTLHKSKVQEC